MQKLNCHQLHRWCINFDDDDDGILLTLQAEISLCRVYKRAGVEDHPSLPRSLPSRASSSSSSSRVFSAATSAHSAADRKQHNTIHTTFMDKLHAFGGGGVHSTATHQIDHVETDGSSNSDVTTVLGLSKHNTPAVVAAYRAIGLPAPMEEEGVLLQQQSTSSSSSKQACPLVPFLTGSSSMSSNIDDLHRLVINYQQPAADHHHQQSYYNEHHHPQQTHQFSPLPTQAQQLGLNTLPSSLPTAFSDRLWDWNPIPDGNRDYHNPFK